MDLKDYALIKKATLTDIGDAIREQEGSAELIPGPDMDERILALAGGGVNFDTIVEVEENSFTNSAEVHEYFVSKIQTEIFVALLLGTVDGTNNQCFTMLGGTGVNNRGAYIRIRDGQWQSRGIDTSFDATIVPGTRYGVIIPKET